ncbi:hypothetical protein I7I53_10311 [Histoplasma capsulatum var. duboisii H88]|nr:hypothetical protein HCDG_03680 [Histoplasma capsulatum H143]QSS49835.1 hypothetical protein I7I53_10311 [Histoplasma capsulatum var. duboisii H88]
MNASKFWKQTCCKIGSRYRLRYYTSLAPLRSRITKPLVATPGNWYLGEAHIGGETVTVQSQSVLDDHDLEQLCHGQFPANCEGEEIRLGKISLDNFRRIRAAFEARAEAEEPIRSYVTYNAKFSTASALKAPSTEVHSFALGELGHQMNGSIEKTFPSTVRDCFRFRIEASQAGFDSEDKSESIIKVPDASLQYIVDPQGGYLQNIFIFQIGFRELYSSLKSSMDLWLEGDKDVQAVILVKFTEKPQYRTPINVRHPPIQFQEDAKLPIAETKQPKLVEESGRVLIHGKVFAHRITGFCELWVRNPDTGKAELRGKRIDFYDSDSSAKIESPELKIDFETYLPNLPELRGKSFVMDWRKMASEVQMGHKRTAIQRYLMALKRCRAAQAKEP